MTVTLATTCYNRGEHVKKTLMHNCACVREARTKMLLLDYSGRDADLGLWLGCYCRTMIANGMLTVVYMRDPIPERWCANHAKNVAALCAKSDIVVNVDADNRIAPGFDTETLKLLAKPDVFASLPKTVCESLAGRLAMRMDDFVKLGGYDEGMRDWGYTDADLRDRARAFGLQEVVYSQEQIVAGVWHSKEDRIEGWTELLQAESFNWNHARSRRNVAEKNLRPNQGKRWGEATVDIYNQDGCETTTVWGK